MFRFLPSLYRLGRASRYLGRLAGIVYSGRSLYGSARRAYRHGRKFYRSYHTPSYHRRMRNHRVWFRGKSRPYYGDGKFGTVLPPVLQPTHVAPTVPPMSWTDTAKTYFHSGLNAATNVVDAVLDPIFGAPVAAHGTSGTESVRLPSSSSSSRSVPVRRRDGVIVGTRFGPKFRLRGHDEL